MSITTLNLQDITPGSSTDPIFVFINPIIYTQFESIENEFLNTLFRWNLHIKALQGRHWMQS
jgi:hypothetical protein